MSTEEEHPGSRWRRVRLGDVCQIVARQVDPRAPDFANLPHVSPENIEAGTCRLTHLNTAAEDGMMSGKYLFEAGDVLYSKLRPYLRKVVVADFRGVCSADMYPIRVRRELLDPYFAAWMLVSGEFTNYAVRESARARMPKLNRDQLFAWNAHLPQLPEQQRIAAILREQMVAVERARAAAEAQLELTSRLTEAYLRSSFSDGPVRRLRLSECLSEVVQGVGQDWASYEVIGATRWGKAPAKEGVGKAPERYKLVERGTIFYNPMRILIGSIAMIDEGEESGITSPDYVVFKTRNGVLHPRWFYHWLRSRFGEAFIKTLARGAVRERMMFRRLASAEIDLPAWESQTAVALKLHSVASLTRALGDQLDAINAFPAAVLRRAFSGEL